MVRPIALARRALITAAPAAVLGTAFAGQGGTQASPGGGDWLAMIKRQHGMIATAFEQLLGRDDQPWEQRDLQLRTLSQLLNSHQHAEQNVIYPALARVGLLKRAEHLYMDEAHAKIMKAELDLLAGARQPRGNWTEMARKLQKSVLEHALQDEEQQAYPELHGKLDAQQNRMLGELFAREIGTIVPPR